MAKIAKKLKVSLTAIAFILGIGVAMAYQAEPESQNPNALKFDCESMLSPTCGSVIQGTIYLDDSDTEAPAEVYDRQYQP